MTFREAFDKILIEKSGKICNNIYEYYYMREGYLVNNIGENVKQNLLIEWFYENSNDWCEYKKPLQFSTDKEYKTRNEMRTKIFMIDNGSGKMLGATYGDAHWVARAWFVNGKLFNTGMESDLDIVDYWDN